MLHHVEDINDVTRGEKEREREDKKWSSVMLKGRKKKKEYRQAQGKMSETQFYF